MPGPIPPDRSSGYEQRAREFMAIRGRSDIGAATVREWAKELPPGASVLDLGCGPGVPIADVLIDAGFRVHGVDASPTLIEAFRTRFPGATAECAAVEDVELAGGSFDAAVAWGLIFLLEPEAQALLIRKVARALEDGGRFLMTAPWQTGQWPDVLTGRTARSLGREAYVRLLRDAGLLLVGETDDEGENHYYFAAKAGPSRRSQL
ncbi:MAG: class I SAM-dependent methyltransferase [Thermoanaerobaculia bacterium]